MSEQCIIQRAISSSIKTSQSLNCHGSLRDK